MGAAGREGDGQVIPVRAIGHLGMKIIPDHAALPAESLR